MKETFAEFAILLTHQNQISLNSLKMQNLLQVLAEGDATHVYRGGGGRRPRVRVSQLRREQGPRDAQRAQRRRAPREGRQPRGARRVGRGGGGRHLLRARRRALRTVA